MAAKTLLAILCCCATVCAETHHTADFGWKARQDVTAEFEALFRDAIVSSGDELVLDHVYRIRGSHSLPDNITLSAIKGGGFEVVDATNENHAVFLALGDRNTLRNLTITYLETPDPVLQPERTRRGAFTSFRESGFRRRIGAICESRIANSWDPSATKSNYQIASGRKFLVAISLEATGRCT